MKTRLTAALLTALAVLLVALPVAAQDAPPPRVAVAWRDGEIDGPIAAAVARLDSRFGHPTYAVEAWTLFTPEGWGDGYDCIVVVGKAGDDIASGLGYKYGNGRRTIVSAQGATRHDTAVMAADAVADCRG